MNRDYDRAEAEDCGPTTGRPMPPDASYQYGHKMRAAQLQQGRNGLSPGGQIAPSRGIISGDAPTRPIGTAMLQHINDMAERVNNIASHLFDHCQSLGLPEHPPSGENAIDRADTVTGALEHLDREISALRRQVDRFYLQS